MDKQTTYETIELRGLISHNVKNYCASRDLLERYEGLYLGACEALDINNARRWQSRIDEMQRLLDIQRCDIEKAIDKAIVVNGSFITAARTSSDHAKRLIDLCSDQSPQYTSYILQFEAKDEN